MINDQYRAALSKDRLRIAFSANLGNIDRAVEDAREFIKTNKLQDHCFAIALGLREALINAVTHGCRGDNSKMVSCFIKLESGKFIIAAHNSIEKVRGRLRVINVSKDIHFFFKAMPLDKHFEVVAA